MKKIINVTIGGIVFPIEEDAYSTLNNYLESIKKHFTKTGDAEEILEDIEIGIAEKFIKTQGKSHKSISLQSVKKVIEEIGTIKDFENENEEKDPTEKEHHSQPIKLYRDGQDKIIGGVASGIAAYFNIDPTIIRLIFVLSFFIGGSGVVIYIILWLIVPEAKTTTQKYEMRGEKLTISAIEESIKKGVERIKKKDFPQTNKIKLFFERIFSLLGSLFTNILPLFTKVIGALFFVAGLLGVLSLGVGTVVLLKTGTIFIEQFPIEIINTVFANWEYYFLGGMAYLIVAVPLLFILILGLSLMRRKNVFRLSIIISLLVVWFGAIAGSAFVAIDKIPLIHNKIQNYRNELPLIENNFEIKPFTEIILRDQTNLIIKQGNSFNLSAAGYEFMMEKMHIINDNNRLEINIDDEFCFWCNSKDLTFTLTIPQSHNINKFDLSGNSSLISENLEFNNLAIEMSGHTKFKLNQLKANNLTTDISGVSQIEIQSGSLQDGNLEISGYSKFKAPNLEFKTLNLDISGLSEADINANEKLDIEASGHSKVNYQLGINGIMNHDISAEAKIKKISDQ